jgi:hypothetical protein
MIFALLHWQILAWPSFLNLKDTVVLFLTVTALWGIVTVVQSMETVTNIQTFTGILAVAMSFFFLRWIRLYVPVLLGAVAAAWLLLNRDSKLQYVLVFGTGAFVLHVVLESSSALSMVNPIWITVGSVDFVLSPKPWGIVPRYSFLILPAVLHWVTAPIAAMGVLNIFRTSRASRFLIGYVVIVVLFYAVVPELRGVRQRYQIALLLAWFQFHGFWIIGQRVELKFGDIQLSKGIERRLAETEH